MKKTIWKDVKRPKGSICSQLFINKQVPMKEIKSRFRELHRFTKNMFSEEGTMCAMFKVEQIEKIVTKADKLWFDGNLSKWTKRAFGGLQVGFDCSDEVAAAYVVEHRGNLCLFVNKVLFCRLFLKGEKSYLSGGLLCSDRLTCMLHVILHELIHVALTVCEKLGKYRDTNHHGSDFDKLSRNMFGHTDSKHGLLPGLEQNCNYETIQKSLKPGKKVKVFVDGKWVNGKIAKIKKGKKEATIIGSKYVYDVNIGLINIFPNL